MNNKNLADFLWNFVLFLGFFSFVSSFISPIKFISNTISGIFIITLFFIPYLKRPNIWTKIIMLVGFTYILSLFLDRIYPINSFIIVIFKLISIVLALGIFFTNLFFPRIFNCEEKIKNSKDNEFILPPKPYRKHPIRSNIIYFLTQYILIFINPIQLYQNIFALIGSLIAELRKIKTNFSPKDFNSSVEYHLPFSGEWIVVSGGINQEDSHSWNVINQRYAYDFVKIDSNKSTHTRSGKNLNDYYCYGKPVLAPAEGRVVAVKGNVCNAKNPGTMWIDFLARDFRGNYVIIKHAEKEYSFMGHFIPGSIMVKKGEFVGKHQVIGQCGNSGYSTEPHLHFHLQDHPNFYLAIGLPIKFKNLKIEGEKFKEAYIKRGEKVEIE